MKDTSHLHVVHWYTVAGALGHSYRQELPWCHGASPRSENSDGRGVAAPLREKPVGVEVKIKRPEEPNQNCVPKHPMQNVNNVKKRKKSMGLPLKRVPHKECWCRAVGVTATAPCTGRHEAALGKSGGNLSGLWCPRRSGSWGDGFCPGHYSQLIPLLHLVHHAGRGKEVVRVPLAPGALHLVGNQTLAAGSKIRNTGQAEKPTRIYC